MTLFACTCIGCASAAEKDAAAHLQSHGALFVTEGTSHIRTVSFAGEEGFDDDSLSGLLDDLNILKPRDLLLSRTLVSDDSISAIAQLKTVERLTVTDSKLTESGVIKIARLSGSLRYIYVAPNQLPRGQAEIQTSHGAVTLKIDDRHLPNSR